MLNIQEIYLRLLFCEIYYHLLLVTVEICRGPFILHCLRYVRNLLIFLLVNNLENLCIYNS